jgi:FMN reductase
MKLVVVSAGLSVPSSTRLLADRLAAATAGRSGADVQVVELRDLAVEIAHTFTNGFPGRNLSAAFDAVAAADGLVVVTPVFSASYSGLFKSFFDALGATDEGALAGKPVLIAATGGTARHSLVLEHALRPLFAYLKAVVVPTGVYAASEDWGAEGLDGRIERAAGELAALMAGLSAVAAGSDGIAGSGGSAGSAGSGGSGGVSASDAGRRALDADAVVPFEERLAALRPAG